MSAVGDAAEGRGLLGRAARAGLRRLRALGRHPLLSRAARGELRFERRGGHPVEADHLPHLISALEWLTRAQDATPDAGFSRAYSVVWNDYFGGRGWQPSYPETTGYIIPTLYAVADLLERPDLGERATRAARWESEIQLPSGAVQGGVIGEGRSPSVFNTGQVIFGWLAALEEDGAAAFEDSARRAGEFLVEGLDADGTWRRNSSRFARGDSTLYNARTSWALAEAGTRLGRDDFVDAAARSLRAVADRQTENGWLPDCCLWKPEQPLLHTLAYAFRGLLEGGRVLGDDGLVRAAEEGARAIAGRVGPEGRLSGQFAADWSEAAEWSCLTGSAQMANVWLRLRDVTGDACWREPVAPVLRYLKASQNRTSEVEGLRGGIKGSLPFSGPYGRYEVLNWATKFFVDALLRDLPVGQPDRLGSSVLLLA